MTVMYTSSLRAFDLLHPTPDQIRIDDIARSLSRVPRFAGHASREYTVAHHLIVCSYVVPPPMQLEALAHDFAEAYIGDITRPLRQLLADSRLGEIERNLEEAIAARFSLEYPWPEVVMDFDAAVCAAEVVRLFPWRTGDPVDAHILDTIDMVCAMAGPRRSVCTMFLDRFAELVRLRQESLKAQYEAELAQEGTL